MDKDGSLEISFNQWRDFLLFHPTTDLREIIQYWRHSTVTTCCILTIAVALKNMSKDGTDPDLLSLCYHYFSFN